MKILLISGSSRNESQTSKVVGVLSHKLKNEFTDVETKIHDLNTDPLSFDLNEVWSGKDPQAKVVEKFQKDLEWADAYVIASPEWNGTATPAIKNIFLYHGLKMAHKAGLLVTVSASMGGAYPMAELRMTTSKNSRINYIPEHLIFREVNEVFNSNEPNHNIDSDVYYHKRASYALSLLVEYGKALSSVRESGIIDHESFENGM